jgi:dTMP kinase
MTDELKRGRFIVIEGADGVGSSTQCRMLVDSLNSKGRRAVLTAEPSRGEIGALARELLKSSNRASPSTLALLFAADRIEHYDNEIRPALQAGIDVVSDRYLLSSYVYQSLDVPLEWVKSLNATAVPADMTLLISLPFDIAWARIQRRIKAGFASEEIFDKLESQERIHTNYMNMLDMVGGTAIDGSGTPQEVAQRVAAAVG